MPAFLDHDDGPGFEYFEEPDMDEPSPGENEQEPPDGGELGAAGRGGSTTGMPTSSRNNYFSPPETPASSPPPVTPRCKIVSARALKDGVGEEGRRKKREDRDHRISDVGGEAGERSARRALAGPGPQRKRGRTSVGSPGWFSQRL